MIKKNGFDGRGKAPPEEWRQEFYSRSTATIVGGFGDTVTAQGKIGVIHLDHFAVQSSEQAL